MEHTQITQRVIDAARLILTSAAANTEQTGCQATTAFATAETRTAETYHLTTAELSLAARLATRAAFATGAYSINAMTDPATRATALRDATHHIDTYQWDQPCSTESDPRSHGQSQTRPTRPRNSNNSAKHSAPHASVWRRCGNYLSRLSTASTNDRTDPDNATAA